MNRAFCLVLPTLAMLVTPSISAPQGQMRGHVSGQQALNEYSDWIGPYRTGSLKASFGNEPGEVKLVITAIENDDQKPRDLSVDFPRLEYSIRYGCSISKDGRVSYFSYTAEGIKGGGYPRLPEADQRRLDVLLTDLPDDASHLPPPNRRLVLQVAAPNGTVARVYDRANAPESVLEILRLTQSRIKSFALALKPTEEWKLGGHRALAATADGREFVTDGVSGSFRFWEPNLHAVLREIPASTVPFEGAWTTPVSVEGLTFSSNGSLLLVEGGYAIDLRDANSFIGLRHFQEWKYDRQLYRLFNPQFTPDGRYLLIQTNQPALHIFETKTLQRVASIPGLPPEAVGFFPASQGLRSVYVTKAGEIELWNPQEMRNIALLDKEGQILRLAYSPDETMIAVVTLQDASAQSDGAYRTRIWRAEDGALVQELRPFEQKAYAIEGLLWSPDGKYLLAATKSDSFFTNRGVGIWSVRTGRHRAELVGCPTNVTGLALLRDSRLVEGCGDGEIRVWEMPEVIKQVRAFETSLPERPSIDSRPAK